MKNISLVLIIIMIIYTLAVLFLRSDQMLAESKLNLIYVLHENRLELIAENENTYTIRDTTNNHFYEIPKNDLLVKL